jgi:hypothetical protein
MTAISLAASLIVLGGGPASALSPGRYVCSGHDLGGGPLDVTLTVTPHAINIRIGEARATETYRIASLSRGRYDFPDERLVERKGPNRASLMFYDMNFGGFDCRKAGEE